MKNTILPMLILSAFLFVHCQKMKDSPVEPAPADFPLISLIRNATTNDVADGTVTLSYDEYSNDDRDLHSGHYSGIFWTQVGNSKFRTYAGELTVESFSIPWESYPDPQRSRYLKRMGGDINEMNFVKNSYGTVMAVNATGSPSFPGFSANIYMPQKMNLQTSNPSAGGELSLSSDMALNWTPDNTFPNSKVYILLMVDNPGNSPNPPVQYWETDDDGHHVIPTSAFQAYMAGGRGTLVCGRGRSLIVTQNDKEIEVITVVYAHDPFDLVQ